MQVIERHPWWDRVILALDHPEWSTLLAWVEQTRPWVTWYKIGPIAFVRHGVQLIHAVHRIGGQVLLDLKLHDIPSVILRTLDGIAHMRVAMVTVHALNGPNTLKTIAEHAATWTFRPLLIAVTILTSHTTPPWDPHTDTRTWAERLTEWAVRAGMDGVVCSAHEVAAIKRRYGTALRTIVPGIRFQPPEDDQRRWATPWDALRAGADWIVIGRALTGAPSIADRCRWLNERFMVENR